MARPWFAATAFISALACASSGVSVPAKLDVGISAVGPYAFVYRPAAAGGVRPLIVLLHGAGQQARPFVEAMRGEADRCGCILLGVQSVGATWDLISAVNKPDRVRANFGMGGKDDMVEAAIDPADRDDRAAAFPPHGAHRRRVLDPVGETRDEARDVGAASTLDRSPGRTATGLQQRMVVAKADEAGRRVGGNLVRRGRPTFDKPITDRSHHEQLAGIRSVRQRRL